MVKLTGFSAFENSATALENINDLSEGEMPEFLRHTLETTLPRPDRKHKIALGVSEKSLAGRIKDEFGYVCQPSETNVVVADLLRGVKMHFDKLVRQLNEGDLERAQLGLGHHYSRARVKFNVNRNDNHIIQAIAALDHADKSVNQFAMRVREWYSWHFPELIKIVSDNARYARLALLIGNKKTLTEDSIHDIAKIVEDDEGIATQIIQGAKMSMGRDISEEDESHIKAFARRVVSLTAYRKQLSGYLISKMGVVAPNLAKLIGEVVGARLISKAGSLRNLAKVPASTVQILGAEKALFRALKTKGATPKYGLLYHSSFIGRAGLKHRGRISRFLANKCSIASRIDNFSQMPSTKFGEALKRQVEERLEFYASGATPKKNTDAMNEALNAIKVDQSEKEALVLPVDNAMEDVLPAPNSNAMSEEKAAKKLSKEEKKMMKKQKKKQERLANGDSAAIDSDASKVKANANGFSGDPNGILAEKQRDIIMNGKPKKEKSAHPSDVDKVPALKEEKKVEKRKRHEDINGNDDLQSTKMTNGVAEGDERKKKKKARHHT